jgi:Tol biopolymer transport system component
LRVVDGKAADESVLIKPDVGAGGSLGMTTSGAIYYDVRRGGPQTYLEVAPFDFAKARVLSPPASNGHAVQSPIPAQYDWSPDGKHLAYVTPNATLGRPGPAIVIRSAETGVVRIIQNDGILSNAQPRWAPDSRILLVPGRGEIHLVDTQTDKISTFKADGALASTGINMPAWSPDGKKIYFEARTKDGPAFFESDPDLMNLREIVGNTPGGLNLTPDGRWIITPIRLTAPEAGTLAAVPVAGGEPRVLLSGPSKGNIFISPDGKYVGLVNAMPETRAQRTASLVATSGGEVREIFNVQAPLAVGMGMWAPDSKSIFLRTLGPDGRQAEMWRVPVDGGQPVKVETGLNLDQFTKYITVSPAGNQIAYIRDERTPAKSEVWALKNFLPARVAK